MKRSLRVAFLSPFFALVLFPVAACDRGAGHGAAAVAPQTDEAMKALKAMRAVPVLDSHDETGAPTFRVGRIEGTLPKGWAVMQLGAQTMYHSPDMQETLHIFGYASEKPLDETGQRAVVVAMTELGARAEKMLGVLGGGPTVSAPEAGRKSWGTTSAFTAVGPLNRVAFHYSAVAPNDALMFQLDGNTETESAADAAALVRSIRVRDAADPAAVATRVVTPAAAKGAPADAAKTPAPPAPPAK